MTDVYSRFLSSPSTAALAANASLHYITTTTSIHEPAAIVKHLQAQEKLIKKKAETIINTIVGGSDVVVETETTFEIVRGGGTILPQMDDNMLVDSLVTVPMVRISLPSSLHCSRTNLDQVHIVQLNSQGQISQIRLYWDQSTLLKQVEAIGRTGRNWPIRDGKAMAKMIKSSASSVENGTVAAQSSVSASAKAAEDDVVITSRPVSSKGREDKDFHTRLFATGEDAEPRSNTTADPSAAMRTSAKPAPRQWGELFPGGPSPDKVEGARPKLGSNKNFGSNRLFDENSAADRSPSPERKKPDPSKFNHFEFGNGEEAAPKDGDRPPSAKAKKHMSNWDFEDFTTPPKVKAKAQPEQERHFGPGIDEVSRNTNTHCNHTDLAQEEPPTPAHRPIVHAPRPDADPHFNMTDAPSPAVPRQPKNTRPDSLGTNLKTEGGVLTAEQKKPLTSNQNSSNIRRGPDINTHYTSTDASPGVSNDENARRDDFRQGGRNTKSSSRAENDKAHWRVDETPEKVGKIYKTAGDGMGGRKDADRSWMIGQEHSEPTEAKIYKTYGNGMGGRRDAAPSWSWGDRDEEVLAAESKGRKIYKTAGDGMGSRKASEMLADDNF